MRCFLVLIYLAFAFCRGTIAADAQSSGADCGISGYPCYSRFLGNGATITDRSGTITIGGTAQTLMPANSARTGCLLQNLSTGDLWINSFATAVQGEPSIWIPAGSFFSCEQTGVPLGPISIYGATTGQTFTAREW
jgi:hypothetical protein